jgi:hypothetical protein
MIYLSMQFYFILQLVYFRILAVITASKYLRVTFAIGLFSYSYNSVQVLEGDCCVARFAGIICNNLISSLFFGSSTSYLPEPYKLLVLI